MKNVDRLVAQGERLRIIRESYSKSAEDIASLLGLRNRQSVYDLESGKRDLKAYEAMQLAEYYGVAPEALLNDTSSEVPVYWRGDADTYAENLLRTRLDRFERLFSLSGCQIEGVPPSYRLIECNSYEKVERVADSLADQLKLGRYPARVLEEALWKTWSVIVFNVPLKSSSGACVRRNGLSAILLNSNEVWWRRNFSLGHEVFHLVFNDVAGVEPARMETLANKFASRLLMPAGIIDEEIRKISCDGRIKYFDLMSLAKEYMVSTEAMLWRLCGAGAIDKASVERFLEDGDLRTLDKDVHSEIEREDTVIPPFLVRLTYSVYLNGSISVGKLAEYLETSIGQLKSVLRDNGIDPFAAYYETSLSNS